MDVLRQDADENGERRRARWPACAAPPPGGGGGGAGAATSATTSACSAWARCATRPTTSWSRTAGAWPRCCPLFGFYLQPAVGGRVLDYGLLARVPGDRERWSAIKVAPFNRYQTLEVVRALAASGRAATSPSTPATTTRSWPTCSPTFPAPGDRAPCASSAGCSASGRCGRGRRWRCSRRCSAAARTGAGARELLALGAQLTDANAALFDARNGFAAASPASTRCCAARGCWPAAGASTPPRTSRRARCGRSTACWPPTRT